MKFSIKTTLLPKSAACCLIVGVFHKAALSLSAAQIGSAQHAALSELIAQGVLPAKLGSTLLVHNPALKNTPQMLLVSLGKAKEWNEKNYFAALRAALKALVQCGAREAMCTLTAVSLPTRDSAWQIRQAVIVAKEITYRFDEFKSEKPAALALKQIHCLSAAKTESSVAESALHEGIAIAEGVSLACDLGNLPGNICTPSYLADAARTLAKTHGLAIEILERAAMEKLGMNALLAVAQGSRQAPKFIVVHYRGADKKTPPHVFVGKGITFDSGGISLKPGADMDQMKYDMCGAASVLGALHTAARLKLALNLTVLVPCTENMPDGAAVKPGDIVRSMSGQTIEILNTDAEGRLILCDALTYAERFKPLSLIDVATLTGACVVALGHVASGLFSNNEALGKALVDAGERAHDRVWPMPLWDDYQALLKSPFADMANIGGRDGGSITAACFLARFVKKMPWAHLDIAGTAWRGGADKGASGRPVPLLSHYLLALAKHSA